MANLTWVSGAAGSWLDPDNWTPTGVPAAGDHAAIVSGAPLIPDGTTVTAELVRLLGSLTLSIESVSFLAGQHSATNIYVTGGDDEEPTHAIIAYSGANSFLGNLFVQTVGGGSLTIAAASPGSVFAIEKKGFLFVNQESLLALSGDFDNSGTIHIEGVGVVAENASLVGKGGWFELDAGGRLVVDGAIGATQSVKFGDGTATLVIADPSTFDARLGLTTYGGDRIILEDSRARSASFEQNTLTLYEGKNQKGDVVASLRMKLFDPADFGALPAEAQTLSAKDFKLSKLGKDGTLIAYEPGGPTNLAGSLPVPAVGSPGDHIAFKDLFEAAFGTRKPAFEGLRLLPANVADPTVATDSYWGQPGINTIPPVKSGWIVNGELITESTVVKKGDEVSFLVGNNIYGPPQIAAQLSAAGKGKKAVFMTYDLWAVDPAVTDLIPVVPGSPSPSDIVASAAAFQAVYGTVLNSELCNWIADNVAAAAGATMPLPDADLVPALNVSGGFWRVAYRGSSEDNPVQDWNTLVQPGDIVRLQWESTGSGHTTTVLGVNQDGSIKVYDNIDVFDHAHHIGAHDNVAYWKTTDPASITIYRLDPDDQYLIEGTDLSERLQGSVFDDLIHARLGADRVFGSIGNDELYGGRDADRIFGGPGDDVLLGGRHGDKLSGGSGSNHFAYTAIKQSKPSQSLRDTILDFTQGVDKIDLSAINAALEVKGKKPFHFIGEEPLDGRPGQLNYTDVGKYLLVEADRNGDATVDFAIKVFGSDKLTAGDFLL